MITKALLVTVTAIVTALFLSAFRVQAANESPHVTMERLERNLGDPKHCEPIRIGPDLAKNTDRGLWPNGAAQGICCLRQLNVKTEQASQWLANIRPCTETAVGCEPEHHSCPRGLPLFL